MGPALRKTICEGSRTGQKEKLNYMRPDAPDLPTGNSKTWDVSSELFQMEARGPRLTPLPV